MKLMDILFESMADGKSFQAFVDSAISKREVQANEGLNIPKKKHQDKYFQNDIEVGVDDLIEDYPWEKYKYDNNGNLIYYEAFDGYWYKYEYDNYGNNVYYEDSYGQIIDNRPNVNEV